MYTLLVRDEQGNMKVVYDWHSGQKPYLMSPQDCQRLAQEVHSLYPNASKGLEFAYYYTGDDWSAMKATKQTDAFEQLPDFRQMRKNKSPDWSIPRAPLLRTAPSVRTEQSIKQHSKLREPSQYTCTSCSWKGGFRELQDRDTDSRYVIGWSCPSCGHEQSSAYATGGKQPPVLVLTHQET